jgi:hypothetical protein
MTATLRALVSALEDDPYCGTLPPHWPGGPLRLGTIQEAIATRFDRIDPQPQPWMSRGLAAVALQQVRLYQLGESLKAAGGPAAEIGGQMSGFASEMFDGTCGSVPLSVLISWLLHHHPPGPQPGWLEDISQVVTQLKLSARMEGTVGGVIQHAALGALKEQLGALQSQKQVR